MLEARSSEARARKARLDTRLSDARDARSSILGRVLELGQP